MSTFPVARQQKMNLLQLDVPLGRLMFHRWHSDCAYSPVKDLLTDRHVTRWQGLQSSTDQWRNRYNINFTHFVFKKYGFWLPNWKMYPKVSSPHWLIADRCSWSLIRAAQAVSESEAGDPSGGATPKPEPETPGESPSTPLSKVGPSKRKPPLGMTIRQAMGFETTIGVMSNYTLI